MTEHFLDAFIGLGSNLGAPLDALNRARRELETIPGWRSHSWSSVYWTEPVGYREQNWFANQVAWLEVPERSTPQSVVQTLLEIEHHLGRVREERWGPRSIDLDLLFLGQWVTTTAEATVPHPYLHQRAFVLVPLAEIAPDRMVPKLNESANQILERIEYIRKGNRIWQKT